MTKPWEMQVEGHRLVAVSPNPCEYLGIPVGFLLDIVGSIFFWSPDLTSSFNKLGSCYSLSLPGHFPAILPKDFTSASILAQLIARLLSCAMQNIVGNRKVLLVGHSMGGFAALSTAIYAPDIVAGIVSNAGLSKGQWTGALGANQWLVQQGAAGHAVFKKAYQLGGVNQAIFRM